MEPDPPPGSTFGAMQQQYIVLVDWWLERVDGEEGKVRVAGTSYAPKKRKGASSAVRAFRSIAIQRRHDHDAIETEDGRQIRIGRLLNMSRTRDNGFSEEVCKSFEFGFPVKWLEILNPNTEQRNAEAQSQSEPTANAPRHSVEYYMEKISSEISTKPLRYAFTESSFCSFTGYTSNTDGNAGNMDASGGLYGGGTNMPEKPLTPPRETCSSGQQSDKHKSMQIDASEQGIDNRSISSVSVNQSTGSICHNSKVDDSILAPSNVVSVEKVGHRSSVGCGQAEEDAGIQHESMQSCSSEQELVTHPIDSAIVNENLNPTSSDLGEPGTQKCGKASLGATDASELPIEKMNQQFGPVRGSEDSTVRRLRSGKVFGTPSSGPMKSGHKQKKIQHEASESDQNMVPNEGDTSTADLTSHENDSSAAGAVTEDKQESHVSRSKRWGRPAKKTKRNSKRESGKLFWNFV
ncbi:unnamed protein product [Urochloa decumbens]|uniref:SANTA domain-containing protein n=1 Tax=Urochloa decumbens TaxID=240449 RepID=A0ABC9EIQ4_9POAL